MSRQTSSLCPVLSSVSYPGFDGLAPHSYEQVISILAKASGLAHDMGKATPMFQDKLAKSEPIKDVIRHEWVSAAVLNRKRRGLEKKALFTFSSGDFKNPVDFPITSASRAVQFIVATHHKMLGNQGDQGLYGKLNNSAHVAYDDNGHQIHVDPERLMPVKPIDTIYKMLDNVISYEKRLTDLAATDDPLYWRAVSILARAAMIMADHVVSSQPYLHVQRDHSSTLHANTLNNALNQPLDWHMAHVGATAGKYGENILKTDELNGLSLSTINTILTPSVRGKYAWQDQATLDLLSFRAESEQAVLVFNTAETGSGKTIMNAKAACALAANKQPVRFANVLNLKTLTLQTGDSMKRDLNMANNELSCIIADKTTRALHESRASNDELAPEDEAFESGFTMADDVNHLIPEWMAPFASGKPYFHAVVGAPVLVSTIDFIIAAGDPSRQGHHVAAMLRLINSDLILDEVDSYDPPAMVAVMRLITLSGLFGRNVICSTATLPVILAKEINQAYRLGINMREALTGKPCSHAVAFIDNILEPQVAPYTGKDDFEALYLNRIEQLKRQPPKKEKRFFFVDIQHKKDWSTVIADAALTLHRDNHINYKGKRISFGLVRMANINPSVATAKDLCRLLPNAFVCGYHSQDFLIQRHQKEKILDSVLNRKGHGINGSPYIDELIEHSPHDDILFIVVATPVEEVGRDHDFDWGVIEPSSLRAIIQAAGRINRHRQDNVTKPNIGLLRFNYKHLSFPSKSCFNRPGFEEEDSPYESHDLRELINAIDGDVVSPAWLFGDHLFSKADNASIEKQLKKAQGLFYPDSKKFETTFAGKRIYTDYCLREKHQNVLIRYQESSFLVCLNQGKHDEKWVARDIQQETLPDNAWLTWSYDGLINLCLEQGIRPEVGMQVSLPVYGSDITIDKLIASGFGFYK